jgi:hypothetical protein
MGRRFINFTARDYPYAHDIRSLLRILHSAMADTICVLSLEVDELGSAFPGRLRLE